MKAQDDAEKAVQLFQEALDIYNEVFTAHPKVAAVYEHIAAVKNEQGLLQDAVTASVEAGGQSS